MEFIHPNELQKIPEWAGIASQYIGACFDCARPLMDTHRNIEPYVMEGTVQLFSCCHFTSESVLILVANGKEWDADILMRSVAEGSFKYIYMLVGSSEEQKQKLIEYWEILPLFSSIKRSDRAQALLQHISNSDDPQWLPLHELIVDDDEKNRIYQKYSRKERHQLESRWSFSEIAFSFAKSENPVLKSLPYLLYNYGMNSHNLHKDSDGVGMIADRFHREPERKNAATLGHFSRLLSDICVFSKLRLWSLLFFYHQELKAIRTIDESYKEFFEELHTASAYFTKVEYGK